MKSLLKRLVRDESGATAIEYGLIAALVSVAIIGALTLLGNSLNQIFTYIGNQLSDAAAGVGS
jgi:pilus assembly protein Flp/PilA